MVTFIPAVLGNGELDWRLTALFLANLTGFSFAFMINEVEDAEDDKKDKKRDLSNPVALGRMSYNAGWWLSMMAGIVSLLLYALLGGVVYLVGVVNFILSLGYSWKKVRFKSRPVVDLLSHGLTLGGMQYLAGYLVYGGDRQVGLLILLFATLVSMSGQLYNQIRDFDADQLAKLKNSANLIGLDWTKRLRWATLVTLLSVGILVLREGVIPMQVIAASIGLMILFKLLGVSAVGTSREKASEKVRSQRLMWDSVLAMNVVVIVWLMVRTGVDEQVMVFAKLGAGKMVELSHGIGVIESLSRLI